MKLDDLSVVHKNRNRYFFHGLSPSEECMKSAGLAKQTISSFFLFSLLAGIPAYSAVLYSFEEGLDGWTNIRTSDTSGGPNDFASYNVSYFQDNYYSSPGVSRLTPADGSYILACDPFGTLDIKTRDNAHETLVIRSPEFYIFEAGSISAYIYGGAGSGSLVDSYADLPVNSSDGGYLGLALRDVETGEYVAEFHKGSSSDDYLYVELTDGQIAPFVSATKKYTLDFIDYRQDSWAWAGIDKVYIESGTLASIPEPASFAMIGCGLFLALLIRRFRFGSHR